MQQLIYNQRRIPEQQWRYGFRSSAAIGCGWVAVYNALCILGEQPDIPTVIRQFERQIPIVNGAFGTFIGTPALLLRSMGYRIRVVNDRKKYDELAKNAPVCILSYYWRRKHRIGAHFIALRWMDDHFEGYNVYTSSNGPDRLGSSLEHFLTLRRYFGTVLTVVEPPEQRSDSKK